MYNIADRTKHPAVDDDPQINTASTRHPSAEPLMQSESTTVAAGSFGANTTLPSFELGSFHADAPGQILGSGLPPDSQSQNLKPELVATETPDLNGRLPRDDVNSRQPINDMERALPSSDQQDSATSTMPPFNEEKGPALPPRVSQEVQDIPPPQPPRPPKTRDVESSNAEAAVMPPSQVEPRRSRRASETYQIRHVNWADPSSSNLLRRSPIMVQNANGPCPLLALVNALVLSTTAGISTALIESLRLREQVSLGLLLDTVIDELMSGRRGDAAQNLPDISDLYAFLINLHTGMNVNPSFVPTGQEPVNLMDVPIEPPSLLDEYRKVGGFEDTREMKLYRIFAIPLIHGWIPPRNHPAFAALKRSARTYEDAQNLLFREEELEEKLSRQGLSPDEQIILEDIASVKYFLSSTATQLTGYGLDTVTETLPAGSIAILFRNDHFSTLYRHPRSGQLLTLVTDMGYAGHDEVVWESLVDVSGEGSELFSGDFRPVGNPQNSSQIEQTTHQSEDESGWETVPSKSQRRSSQRNVPLKVPMSTLSLNEHKATSLPTTEQEDHDLALAMQMQEEEEERDRQEAAARRREDELSQAYLSSSDSQGRRTFPGFGRGAAAGPSVPPRGGGARPAPPTRPAPRKSSSSEDAPPPSYEQAAKGPAYHPPANHPAHPHASPSPGERAQRPPAKPPRPRQSSAYSEHSTTYAGSPANRIPPRRGGHASRSSASGPLGRGGLENAPGIARRRSGAPGSAVSLEDDRRDKDCIVM